jgi:hypothetical protein
MFSGRRALPHRPCSCCLTDLPPEPQLPFFNSKSMLTDVALWSSGRRGSVVQAQRQIHRAWGTPGLSSQAWYPPRRSTSTNSSRTAMLTSLIDIAPAAHRRGADQMMQQLSVGEHFWPGNALSHPDCRSTRACTPCRLTGFLRRYRRLAGCAGELANPQRYFIDLRAARPARPMQKSSGGRGSGYRQLA